MKSKSLLFVPFSIAAGALAIGAGSLFQATENARRNVAPDLRAGAQSESATSTQVGNPIQGSAFGAGPMHKVWIEGNATSELARLAASGALVRAHDYGAFTLAIVDARAWKASTALTDSGFEFRDEQDLVAFNEIVLDTQHPEATLSRLPDGFRLSAGGASALDANAGLYVVQFEGPIRDEWVAELDALGVRFRQFVPMNAYVVELAPANVANLETWAAAEPVVQFVGVYEPAFRVHADLRAVFGSFDPTLQPVTIQLVAGPSAEAALAEIRQVADTVADVREVGPYLNVHATLHPAFLQTLATLPAVFQIEPRGVISQMDERQGQILAANVTATGPSAPGYLTWLAGAGFNSSQFGSFAVNVADDATSLTGHPDLPSGRVAFTLNPTGQTGAQGGHGFLNANIIGGFNSGTGSTVEDTGGYNYGLGVAPFARVGSTAIFGSGALDPTTYESQAYGLGARISSNSWGFQTAFGGPVPDYDAWSQEYDFIARDAQSGTAGNQGYVVVFSAGNNGSGTNTVSTPGTAKNILTVAAGENDRQTGTDGCGITNTGANNWNDIASFSSRGPVNSSGGDGRWKPEISAPGTHIEAGVPQSNYNGSSVCNQYFPSGQTLYGWSSGTSHSCPAVAGGAALAYQWFLNNGLGAPSPAMVKAALVASGEYMTGTGANDTLPSNSQGAGTMNLQRAFGPAARVLQDQSTTLGASGQTHSVSGNIDSSSLPFRVALVWTDAPGPTSGAPYVNNLDLTVTVNGTTYRGNVFSGRNSIAGGAADIRNNTELVFLPAGTTGSFTATVTATAIGGDGVPGNADTTDQDFALVVYNGSSGPPPAPVANFTGAPTSGTAPLAVNFTDSSTGSITSWSWTFGDGGTSTAQNPSHTYTATGTYSVSLTVVGPGGSDSLTRTNYVSVGSTPPPVANFTGAPTSGTAPLAVNFTDSSTGSITGWSWTFGDGGTSTAQNPSHTYAAAGTYTVSLLVSGPGGSNTQTRTNYISVSPAGSGTLHYVSFSANTSVPGVGTVADEDIVSYNSGTGTWAMFFDGSDVGLASTDVNAFEVLSNGSILMSLDSTTFSVPGLTGGPNGTTVEDRDLILFTPASTGSTTSGSFSFTFDGSDVGLTTSSEDIDGVIVFPDGSIGISTVGNPGVTGLTGLADEDVIRFTGTFGSATSGTWSYYFDGSDVGLSANSNGDSDAIGTVGSDLILSTTGAFTAGISWGSEDLVRFTGAFGTATSGSFSMQLDLSTLGISTTANVDGVTIVP